MLLTAMAVLAGAAAACRDDSGPPDPAAASTSEVVIGVDQAPDPAARELRLWVSELACNGGGDPVAERLAPVEVVETEATITVSVTLARSRPPENGKFFTCGGPPPTYVTVPLAAPVGGRTLLDGTRDPVEPLTIQV